MGYPEWSEGNMSMQSRLSEQAETHFQYVRKHVVVRGKQRRCQRSHDAVQAEMLELRVLLSGEVNIQQVGHWGGTVEAVAVSGTLAYACQGQDLLVVDVSVPSAPSQIGAIRLPGDGTSVSVVGSYAYVTNDYSGLEIINISIPAAPTRLSGFDTAGVARGVSVVGNYAYVADDYSGLQIIDIGNKSAPARVGGLETPGSAYAVSVVGNYAYVAAYDKGLQIVDIRNPAAPALVGGFDTAGSAYDVSVTGSFAYVADGSKGLQVIDISTPSAPVRMDGIVTNPDRYSPSEARGVRIVGDYAYVADDLSGLQIVDIHTRSAPVFIGGRWNTQIARARGVSVVGNYAYVAARDEGFEVIDIRQPSAQVRVGGFDTAIANARGVSVAGNYAYVAHERGLEVLDISNPSTPVRVGGSTWSPENVIETPFGVSGYPGYRVGPQAVSVVGNYAYVACSGDGLKIIDIRNPASPVIVGTWTRSIRTDYRNNWNNVDAHDVAISGSFAYIAGCFGLWVIDISFPSAPVDVTRAGVYNIDTVDVWFYPMLGVSAVGNRVYVATEEVGVEIYDHDEPDNLSWRGRTSLKDHTVVDVSVVGNYAYTAEGYGADVYDISNPSSQVHVADLVWGTYPKHISVVGKYAYVRHDSGFDITDVSTLSTPVNVAATRTFGGEGDFSVVGNRLYLADGDNGLVILRTGDQNQPPTNLTLSSASIPEGKPLGTVVGSLAVTDLDGGGAPYTYTLASGTGSTDNASFEIVNGQLKTRAMVDYEVKSNYSIRVRVTDQGGLTFDKVFAIGVSDVAEALVVNGTAGNDVITLSLVGDKIHVVNGSSVRDYALSMTPTVSVYGLDGNDTITVDIGTKGVFVDGGVGLDTITTGAGNDTISGGYNADSIIAGVGDDSVTGGNGADVLNGDAGNDILLGGKGADSLYGGGGSDTLTGGTGSDQLFGGKGTDWFYGRDRLSDTITGGAGTDQAQVDNLLDVMSRVELLLA